VDVLFEIAVYIPVLPALLAALVWRSLWGAPRKFAICLWAIALFSVSGEVWKMFGHDNNLPFFHTYILVEFLLLLLVYKQLLSTARKSFIWLTIGSAFALIWLLNVFFGEGFWEYPNYIHALEAILLIVFAVLWFLKILREKVEKKPAHTFGFWLSTGILMYYTCNLLLFFSSSFVGRQSPAVFDAVWGVHAILVILLHLTYSIAILWALKTPKSS